MLLHEHSPRCGLASPGSKLCTPRLGFHRPAAARSQRPRRCCCPQAQRADDPPVKPAEDKVPALDAAAAPLAAGQALVQGLTPAGGPQSDLEKTTEKYGLEAGLWQAFRGKGGKGNQGQQAKDLLTRYGGAYLLTSISFAIVSFAACYALVSAGGLAASDCCSVALLDHLTVKKGYATMHTACSRLAEQAGTDPVRLAVMALLHPPSSRPGRSSAGLRRPAQLQPGITLTLCRRGRQVAARARGPGLRRNRGEGWHLCHRICSPQGPVAHPLPSHRGPDASRGALVRQEAARAVMLPACWVRLPAITHGLSNARGRSRTGLADGITGHRSTKLSGQATQLTLQCTATQPGHGKLALHTLLGLVYSERSPQKSTGAQARLPSHLCVSTYTAHLAPTLQRPAQS